MNVSELIEQLQKVQKTVWDTPNVYIHYDGQEIETYGVSVRILWPEEFEVVLE